MVSLAYSYTFSNNLRMGKTWEKTDGVYVWSTLTGSCTKRESKVKQTKKLAGREILDSEKKEKWDCALLDK